MPTGELKSTPAFFNSFTRFSAAALNSELAARRSMVIFDGTPWLISIPVIRHTAPQVSIIRITTYCAYLSSAEAIQIVVLQPMHQVCLLIAERWSYF